MLRFMNAKIYECLLDGFFLAKLRDRALREGRHESIFGRNNLSAQYLGRRSVEILNFYNP